MTKVIIIGDVITDTVVQLEAELARATDTPSQIKATGGGSGANQAAWLAQLAGNSLKVHFVGRVGQDVFGIYHRQELEKWGVVTHLASDSELNTGQIVVLVEPNGERHMLTDRGANVNLAWENIPTELFQPGAHLHISGYSLAGQKPREAILKAFELARQQNISISVDPASTTLLKDVGVENFLEWTTGAKIIFPNLEEGQLLSGQTEPDKILGFLTKHYNTVVLKLGGEGAQLAQQKIPYLVSYPAENSGIIDTTGAGDAFCAGFLHAHLTGQNNSYALAAAVKTGTQAAQKLGGRPN